MNVKTTLRIAFIITVSGPYDVISQTCDPDIDENMEVDDAFGASFPVLETLNNIGRRQCHQTCYDVDICHYVRYDSIHLTCDLLESDEGYINFDLIEDCDYNFWVREHYQLKYSKTRRLMASFIICNCLLFFHVTSMFNFLSRVRCTSYCI